MMSSFKRTRQNMDSEMEKQRADRAGTRKINTWSHSQ